MDTFKGGLTVPDIWQTNYAKLVEELGGTVEIKEYPNDDHFSLPNSCAPDALKWLNGLF
jgi:hypothetical protein